MILRIAVCGIDGSGKSTLIEKLLTLFEQDNIVASYARVPFPSKEAFFKIEFPIYGIEQEIVKRTGMAFDFVRYYTSFKATDGILLCDRYDMDYEVLNDVYCLPEIYLETLHLIYNQAPTIDLYIYLRIDASLAGNRLNKRGNRKDDENDKILNAMQQVFEEHIQHRSNVLILDAARTSDSNAYFVKKKILDLWENKND